MLNYLERSLKVFSITLFKECILDNEIVSNLCKLQKRCFKNFGKPFYSSSNLQTMFFNNKVYNYSIQYKLYKSTINSFLFWK